MAKKVTAKNTVKKNTALKNYEDLDTAIKSLSKKGRGRYTVKVKGVEYIVEKCK